MRKVKLDNSDLLAYFNTIEELKNHPSMEEYRTGYRKLRDDDAFSYEINKYRSAHTTLRRLDKKKTISFE
jgi:DNA/RNA-binding domain of Phe-tRNA-synthetase-like protein